MRIRDELNTLGLNPDNSVVIGSGILSAKGIRQSSDVDIVVGEEAFKRLEETGQFKKKRAYNRDVLVDDLFEININWGVLGKDQQLDDLMKNSIVIEGVRYITLDFLLTVKESWLNDDTVRQKDVDDVKLIKDFIQEQNKLNKGV